MPFDFNTGRWDHNPDIIFECVPAPEGGSSINFSSGGLIGIRKPNGKILISGDPTHSVGRVEKGETVILFTGDNFWFSYNSEFSLPGEKELIFQMRLNFTCKVNQPDICDQRLIRKHEIVNRDQIEEQIATDSGFFKLLENLLINNGNRLNIEIIQNQSKKFLAEFFGLGLIEISGKILEREEIQVDIKPGILINDKYLIKEKIGQGAFGEVWQVEDINLGHALKVLKSIKDKELKKFIQSEIEILGMVENRQPCFNNLARLLDVIPGEDILLIYQYIDGWDLNQFWKDEQNCNNRHELFRIIDQVLCGLEALHDIHLIHRDLHPGNIMIERKNRHNVFILDLGLAVEEGIRSEQDIVNSIQKIKPTHPFAEPSETEFVNFDKRTDLFSIGVLLWWMITGKKNLPRGKPLEEYIPEWARAYQPVIEKACIVPREDRFRNAAEMREALQQAYNAPIMIQAHQKGVYSIAFTPKSDKFITGGRDGQIVLWSMERLQKEKIFDQQKKEVLSLAFISEEEFIIVEKTDSAHEIRKINISSGKEKVICKLDCDSTSASISPTAGIICFGTYQGKVISIDMDTGMESKKDSFDSDHDRELINCIAISPSGKYIGAGTSQGYGLLLDRESGKIERRQWGGRGAVWTLSFNYLETEIALGGNDPVIRVMTTNALIEKNQIHQGPTHGISHHPSEDVIAIARQDGKIIVWGRKEISRSFGNNKPPVWELKFSPDGSHLIFGGLKDGKIFAIFLH